MTQFTKVSLLTGKTNSVDLPVTEAEVEEWASSRKNIQDALPQLNATQREFLLSGATQEEWDKAFKEDDA